MKSASGSAQRPRWRLSRTLKRATDFRPIEVEDERYLWAAYKQGALSPMGEQFADGKMTVDEFRKAFERAVIDRYHAAWTLFANTKRGFIPVGMVFASWAPNGSFLIVHGATWLPWASNRNIIESMIGFLSRIRSEFPLQFYCLAEHKRLYEVCAMHGVVRRIGTSYVAIKGKAAALFETRTSEAKAA